MESDKVHALRIASQEAWEKAVRDQSDESYAAWEKAEEEYILAKPSNKSITTVDGEALYG